MISAVGGLVDPKMPDIAGIESFEGESFHTARWNHGYDLRGKRVAVIGTGASAVQVVPSIAPKVKRLEVFQRTPAWVVPKRDGVYSESQRRFFERFPVLPQIGRSFRYGMSELFGPRIHLNAPRLSARGKAMSKRHLHAQVKDPELRRQLLPHFQFGCKRTLVSDDYWACFERDNVGLQCSAVERIEPGGVRCADGTPSEVDAIVFATGFDLGLAAAPFEIRGRGGRSRASAWERGAVAYEGMALSGFPNWRILMGPDTGPGHTSVLFFTEAQIRHARVAIERMKKENLRCASWYLGPDGSNHSPLPGPAFESVAGASAFHPRDYRLVGSGADAGDGAATAA